MNTALSSKGRFFPSARAAVVVGAMGMPLFVLGWQFIASTFQSQALVLLWAVFAFFAPVLLATVDIKYAFRRFQENGSFFRPLISAEDFRLLHLPGGKRIAVWYVSTIISILILKAVGLEL